MKRFITLLSLCALCFGAGYSYQSTANFSIQWTASGADQAAANQALARYLASAVQGSSADADIWQRDADGVILLDAQGRKRIAPAKVAPAFKAILSAKVQEWAESGDIGELGAIQTQSVVNQVRQQPKPVVQ